MLLFGVKNIFWITCYGNSVHHPKVHTLWYIMTMTDFTQNLESSFFSDESLLKDRKCQLLANSGNKYTEYNKIHSTHIETGCIMIMTQIQPFLHHLLDSPRIAFIRWFINIPYSDRPLVRTHSKLVVSHKAHCIDRHFRYRNGEHFLW